MPSLADSTVACPVSTSMTIHVFHFKIQHRDIESFLPQDLNGFKSAAGLADLNMAFCDSLGENIDKPLLIVYQKQPDQSLCGMILLGHDGSP